MGEAEVIFDLDKDRGDKFWVHNRSHEHGDQDVNTTLIVSTYDGSPTANGTPKKDAVDHFKVVHFNEVVKIDVCFAEGGCEVC